MNVRALYAGVPGRAPYIQGSQIRQFTIWSKKDAGDSVLYVYLPSAQVDHDKVLMRVCEQAVKVDTGFMVTVRHWESKVNSEGALIG